MSSQSQQGCRFHVTALLLVSLGAGVLLFLNFKKSAIWHLDYGPVEYLEYQMPIRRTPPDTFHTHLARGYGWPYLVNGRSYADISPDPNYIEWSWLGFVGNIIFNGMLLFLGGVLFETADRLVRSRRSRHVSSLTETAHPDSKQ